MAISLSNLLRGSKVPDQAMREQMVFGTGRLLFVLLLVSIALYEVSAPGVSSLGLWASTLGLACLVFLGAFTISALPGFLFALPRLISGDGGAAAKDRRFRPGNLEDVADWLTKVLLGIGLTQINGLPSRLWAWSTQISETGFGSHRFAPAILFLALAGASLGFLFAYLVTRIKINQILALEDTAIQKRYQSVAELTSSDAAPVADEVEQDAKISPEIQRAAVEVAEAKFEDMHSREEKLAWARAQVLLHKWPDAAYAFEAILRTYPNDRQAAEDYVHALYQAKDFETARRIEAHFLGTGDGAAGMTVEHRLNEMLTLLYEPDGYEEALRIGASLAKNKDALSQARYWVYVAAAFGEKHKALIRANASEDQLKQVRDNALAAIRKVKETDKEGGWLRFVRGLVDPASVPGHPDSEDDLVDFRDDEEFRAEVGLPMLQR